jgi:hypothetical protein
VVTAVWHGGDLRSSRRRGQRPAPNRARAPDFLRLVVIQARLQAKRLARICFDLAQPFHQTVEIIRDGDNFTIADPDESPGVR